MTTLPPSPAPATPAPARPRWDRVFLLGVILVTALVTFLVAWLLTTIFTHKQEAKNPYLRFVEVTADTTNPEPWGANWPREYDDYKKTVTPTRTNFGGGDTLTLEGSTVTEEKAKMFPFLTRMFAGYAFSLDYRDRRGHAYMLLDQEKTRRVRERPQPGACLNCHTSVVPTYLRLGGGTRNDPPEKQAEAIQKGFVELCKLPYLQGHAEVEKTGSLDPVIEGKDQKLAQKPGAHPVSCVDCHDPKTMQLRVNRPAFLKGMQALAEGQGEVLPGSSVESWRKGSRNKPYDVNADASRQEMRTFVCAQCHVEYYCGPKVTLFYPWNYGRKVEQIEAYYNDYKFPDGHRFYDWTHAETGAELLKAQHPEFELYSQGIHAARGVACADCHMPYQRQGAMKVSDHWVRSPLLNIARSCQVCHPVSEGELQKNVEVIQSRNLQLLQQAGAALIAYLDEMKLVRAPFDEKNRATAEEKARGDLSKKDAYAKASPEEQAKQLKAATTAALNDAWAQHVAQDAALKEVGELQRKAQWRLDFVAAENSMGFHAPQEAARILGESANLFRQAQVQLVYHRTGTPPPASAAPATTGMATQPH